MVVAADGTVLYSGEGEARTIVSVTPGVYVVTVDNAVRKVIVK